MINKKILVLSLITSSILFGNNLERNNSLKELEALMNEIKKEKKNVLKEEVIEKEQIKKEIEKKEITKEKSLNNLPIVKEKEKEKSDKPKEEDGFFNKMKNYLNNLLIPKNSKKEETTKFFEKEENIKELKNIKDFQKEPNNKYKYINNKNYQVVKYKDMYILRFKGNKIQELKKLIEKEINKKYLHKKFFNKDYYIYKENVNDLLFGSRDIIYHIKIEKEKEETYLILKTEIDRLEKTFLNNFYDKKDYTEELYKKIKEIKDLNEI